MTSDPHHLERFVQAQAPVFASVRAELGAGRKRSHWMWFVFPQLKALGRSSTARFFGLDGAADARAYALHPVLGARLRDCTEVLLGVPDLSAHQIFGSPDDLKLRSCLTLFDAVAPEHAVFDAALRRFYGGERDPATLALLAPEPGDSPQHAPHGVGSARP